MAYFAVWTCSCDNSLDWSGEASQQFVPAHANTRNLLILPPPAIPDIRCVGMLGESMSGSTYWSFLRSPGSIRSLFFNFLIALSNVLHRTIIPAKDKNNTCPGHDFKWLHSRKYPSIKDMVVFHPFDNLEIGSLHTRGRGYPLSIIITTNNQVILHHKRTGNIAGRSQVRILYDCVVYCDLWHSKSWYDLLENMLQTSRAFTSRPLQVNATRLWNFASNVWKAMPAWYTLSYIETLNFCY